MDFDNDIYLAISAISYDVNARVLFSALPYQYGAAFAAVLFCFCLYVFVCYGFFVYVVWGVCVCGGVCVTLFVCLFVFLQHKP